MVSFLAVLVFAPVVLGLTWMYMSPLPRLHGYTLVKVIIRIVLVMAIFGGFLAQLNFLARNEPSNTRRFYVMAFVVIESVSILLVGFYRYYQNPSSYGSWRPNRTDGSGKKDYE